MLKMIYLNNMKKDMAQSQGVDLKKIQNMSSKEIDEIIKKVSSGKKLDSNHELNDFSPKTSQEKKSGRSIHKVISELQG